MVRRRLRYWRPGWAAGILALTSLASGGPLREDRELFAEIRAAGEREVEITLAAREEGYPELVQRLRTLNAQFVADYADIDIGIVRVPVAAADEIIAWPEVVAWRAAHATEPSPPAPAESTSRDVSDGASAPPAMQPAFEGRLSSDRRAPGPDSGAARAGAPGGPRLITGADVIGMTEFWRKHPTYDGRGTTALVQDSYVDPVHPQLTAARTLSGQVTRKIRALLPPVDEGAGTGWWPCSDEKDLAGRPTVELDGRTYRKPGAGPYLYGVLDEKVSGAFFDLYAHDFNHDGNPPGSSARFGICWDEKGGRAWIDRNQNGDFADDPPLHSYAATGDIALAGADHPATPVTEANPYFVEFDVVRHAVWVGALVASYHGTMVAGAMAGSGMLDGNASGPAPGAQIVSQRGARALDLPTVTFRELGRAFQEDWDVFQCSEGYDTSRRPSPSASSRLMESPNIFVLALERWLKKTGRTLVYAADNEFRSQVAKSDSFGRCGLAVGAYLSGDLWLRHFGISMPAADYVAPAGARGPSLDGAVCPEVLAPTGILTLKPFNFAAQRLDGACVLPKGYMLGGGTSTAAPVASGLALALISAAKQSGIPYDGQRIKRAMIGGARWLDGIPAHEQGNGVLDAERAWEVLQRQASKEVIAVDSRGPIRIADGTDRHATNLGVGLYEREGWRVGQRETRTLHFTRLNGPLGPQRYLVRLKGNDGTFRADSALTLPLRQEVDLPVEISPKSTGVHSAIVELADSDGDFVHQCMACIIAAEDFPPSAKLVLSGSVPRPSRKSFFVRVPPGVAALVVKQTVVSGELFFNYYDPSDEQPGYAGMYFSSEDSLGNRTFAHPAPGVWEIAVNNEHDATYFDPTRPKLTPAEFRLEVYLKKAAGTVLKPGFVAVQSGLSGGRQGLRGQPLVARRTQRLPLSRGLTGSAVVDVEVPPGTAAVTFRAEAPGADLNLYAFDRRRPAAPLVWADALGLAPEKLRLEQPPAGTVRVVVDPYRIPADRVEAEVTIEISHAGYGATISSTEFSDHGSNSNWEAPYQVVAGPAPIPPGWTRTAYVAIADAEANDCRFSFAQRTSAGRLAPGSKPSITSIPVGKIEVPAEGPAGVSVPFVGR